MASPSRLGSALSGLRVTHLLLCALGATFLAQILLPRTVPGAQPAPGTTEVASLWALGANGSGAVLRNGEWWRLYAATFLHAGLLHIFFNAFALFQLGPLAEQVFGSARTAFTWFLGGLAASICSLAWAEWQRGQLIGVGASGAVCSLLGLLTVHLLRRPEGMLRAFGRRLLHLAVLNAVLGFLIPHIDNAAHGGGFLAGAVLAYLFPRHGDQPPGAMVRAGALVLGAAAFLALGIALAGARGRLDWSRSVIRLERQLLSSASTSGTAEHRAARIRELQALPLHRDLHGLRERAIQVLSDPGNADSLLAPAVGRRLAGLTHELHEGVLARAPDLLRTQRPR
jgi:membrane associated rhomboid family serine protease